MDFVIFWMFLTLFNRMATRNKSSLWMSYSFAAIATKNTQTSQDNIFCNCLWMWCNQVLWKPSQTKNWRAAIVYSWKLFLRQGGACKLHNPGCILWGLRRISLAWVLKVDTGHWKSWRIFGVGCKWHAPWHITRSFWYNKYNNAIASQSECEFTLLKYLNFRYRYSEIS